MVRKIIEHEISSLHKLKVEQAEVISSLLFIFSSQIIRTFGSNTFSNFFHGYDITSLGNTDAIKFRKYTKHPIKVSLKISTCSFKKM